MSLPVLIVMGVSGVGKSTIAEHLNQHLRWPYQEGDELHPAANVEKMKHGVPLNDADRAPWLAAVKTWIDTRVRAAEPGIITCSALKRRYRNMLVDHRSNVRILYLRAGVHVLEEHLAHRTGHFMPPSLLGSQLDTLEEPGLDENPITIQVIGNVDETVRAILEALRSTYSL
jgi:carbohydrate kinase (thermoresistant glucokinase family)